MSVFQTTIFSIVGMLVAFLILRGVLNSPPIIQGTYIGTVLGVLFFVAITSGDD